MAAALDLIDVASESSTRMVRALSRVGLKFALSHAVAPLSFERGRLTVASVRPEDEVRKLLVEHSSIGDIVVRQANQATVNNLLAQLQMAAPPDSGEIASTAARTLARSLADTVIKGGTDLWCYPTPDNAEIHAYVNGSLRLLRSMDRDDFIEGINGSLVPNRITNHNPNEPQAGGWGVTYDGIVMRMRLRTFPLTMLARHSNEGDVQNVGSVNFRIHPDERDLPEMIELGLPARAIEDLRWAVGRMAMQGIVSGQPGSGKTTTLYAFLREMSRTHPNIYTLESPIEIFIRSLRQREITNLSEAIEERRALLQSKPWLVFIGEALSGGDFRPIVEFLHTGITTVTTFHERSALGAMHRAIEEVGAFYLSKVGVVWAQALINPVCPSCAPRSSATPPSAEAKDIARRLGVELTSTLKRSGRADCALCLGGGTVGPARPLVETIRPTNELRDQARHSWHPATFAAKVFNSERPSIAMQSAALLAQGVIDEQQFFETITEEEIP